MRKRGLAKSAAIAMAALALTAATWAEDGVTLRRAVALAVGRQTAQGEASVGVERASAAEREARAAWLPAIYAGSGLGYSYGSPAAMGGSAPTLFNVGSTQYLFNEPARWRRKALAADREAAQSAREQSLEQTAAETAEAYMRLCAAIGELDSSQSERRQGERLLQTAMARRVEGMDGDMDVKRAELMAARAEMRAIEAQTLAASLKLQLSTLTGLRVEDFAMTAPARPEPPQTAPTSAVDWAAQKAEAEARAAELRVRAETSWRLPVVDLAGQYAMLSRYNNYDEYYRKFSRNNFSVGVEIRLPIVNLAQRERIKTARLEALSARARAASAREQSSLAVRRAADATTRLTALSRVRRLEAELAEGEAAQARARLDEGGSLRELESSEIEAVEKQAEARTAELELRVARLRLLQAQGGVRAWVETQN